MVFTLVLLFANGVARGDTLTAERAAGLALEHSADVAVRAADVRAARARLEGARAPLHANPELEVAAGPRTRAGDRTTDVEVALTQGVEVFGQRGARIDVARAEVAAAEAALGAKRSEVATAARVAFGRAAAAEAALGAKRSEVATAARVAFARAAAAERQLAIADQDVALARESVRAAEQRAELGSGTRLELNAARADVGRAARDRAIARQALDAARSELRLLLGVPASAALTLTDEATPAAPVDPTDVLVERALASRKDVVAARHELAAAAAEERLASREWLPSPKLGARYAREEGANIVLASISFDVPVWNRNAAERGGAAARVARSKAELDATERRVREEVIVAVARVAAARETMRAYDADVVAATAESLALAGKAYEAGKLGLLEVLLVRRSALDAQRGEVEARAELAEAAAELLRALGAAAPERP